MFEDPDGKPLAAFINCPIRCCFLNAAPAFGEDLSISADIAGQVCTWNDGRDPGAVTLWRGGAAGDINPIFMEQLEINGPRLREPFPKPLGDGPQTGVCTDSACWSMRAQTV